MNSTVVGQWGLSRYFEYNIWGWSGDHVCEWVRVYMPGPWKPVLACQQPIDKAQANSSRFTGRGIALEEPLLTHCLSPFLMPRSAGILQESVVTTFTRPSRWKYGWVNYLLIGLQFLTVLGEVLRRQLWTRRFGEACLSMTKLPSLVVCHMCWFASLDVVCFFCTHAVLMPDAAVCDML